MAKNALYGIWLTKHKTWYKANDSVVFMTIYFAHANAQLMYVHQTITADAEVREIGENGLPIETQTNPVKVKFKNGIPEVK